MEWDARSIHTNEEGTEIHADEVWYTAYDDASNRTLIANSHHHPYTWANEGDILRIGDQTYEVAYVDPNNINGAQGIYVYGDASARELGEDIYLLNVHETIIKVSGDASQ